MEEVDNLLQRSAMNFGDQREVRLDIPKNQNENSVQLYFDFW
jgi:hypothetical protein